MRRRRVFIVLKRLRLQLRLLQQRLLGRPRGPPVASLGADHVTNPVTYLIADPFADNSTHLVTNLDTHRVARPIASTR